jgi:YebC/PmpR family DNA-binding regulatory protein
MSGHSKWAGIKHKKAKVDAQRGRVFTKVIREITVAARVGGGDPAGNPRLRLAIDKAKAVNMPQDNIQRAIQKGTGELPGVSYEEYIYEGYGPGGVAVLLEVVTDNKNRTTPEIRKAFAKHAGNLGEAGCVAWMFDKRGLIQVEAAKTDEDRLFGVAWRRAQGCPPIRSSLRGHHLAQGFRTGQGIPRARKHRDGHRRGHDASSEHREA